MNLKNTDPKKLAVYLVKKAGFNCQIQSIERIYQGGNNQLYKVFCNSNIFAMKVYYCKENETISRLESEYSFLEVANQITPNYVPKVYSKSNSNNAALFQFVKGKKISNPAEIKEKYILQAADFISKLNSAHSKENSILKNAAEACFSIDDHLCNIDHRILQLNQSKDNSSEYKDTLSRLNSKWEQVKNNCLKICELNHFSKNKALENYEKIISPSDFGFHNSIIDESDNAIFIDFEYAGWDDPAKLVGDFFAQISVPIPPKYLLTFVKSALDLQIASDPNFIRISALLNPYKIKWCCIALNVFLEKHLERRCFSNPNLDIQFLKSEQIKKSHILLESILL